MSSKSSKSDAALSVPDTVVVGRVRKPHGVRGEVAVEVLSDVSDRFAVGAEMSAVSDSLPARQIRIASVRRATEQAIVRFEGFDSRDKAQELRGARLEVSLESVPAAPSGSYFFFELVGCECEDATAGELGIVEDILEDGGGLVLEIETDKGRLLIPFVEAYLKRVDPVGRRIEVDLPEGLIEACTSPF
jgi:16S rRNA processing protein RimM